MPPLQVNSRLTRIVSAGSAPDWDEPGSAGAEKWAGSEPAYYREHLEREVDAGGATSSVLTRRTLILGHDGTALPHIDTNDILEFDVDELGAMTGSARAIGGRQPLPGLSAELSTARIELEPAATPDSA